MRDQGHDPIQIDCRHLAKSAEAYAYLYEQILAGRPTQASYNLDALYDVLSQLPPGQEIVVSHYADLQARERRWAKRWRRVLLEAARDWALDLTWEENDDAKH